MLKAIAVTIGVIATLGLTLFRWYLKNHSAERKKKEDAKAKLDKAIDSGSRIDVIDAFNDL